MISIDSPSTQDIGVKEIFFSINKINYYPLYYQNEKTGLEKIKFIYYDEIKINSITPKFGFYNSDIEILIDAVNVIDNDYLRCKIEEFTTTVTKVIIANKPFYKCIIPHVDDLSFDFEDKFYTNTMSQVTNLKISMSNNNQQYSGFTNFTLYKNEDQILVDYLYSPRIGPYEGNSLVSFTCATFTKFMDTNDINTNVISCMYFFNF